MAPSRDDPADSNSLLASRDADLTARFIDDALPYLSQLSDRASRLTSNPVVAEDLVQETMLRAFATFDTFAEGTNLRGWLYLIMTTTYVNCLRRAHHCPSDYLIGHGAGQSRYSGRAGRSSKVMQWLRCPTPAGATR
ncbi:sigma factor [Mycobacterium sp. NPDC048908]|uniref:sigma factor n=1 Tax=Mycobacterium sp. NPDC048908 TaxID=3364292 RepID=UPI0037140D34